MDTFNDNNARFLAKISNVAYSPGAKFVLALITMARSSTCRQICHTFTFIGIGRKVMVQDCTHILITLFFINAKHKARLPEPTVNADSSVFLTKSRKEDPVSVGSPP